MMENPKVFTPKNLKDVANVITPTATNQTQIANNTLRDFNEVLKTVDSIAGKFGYSLKEMMAKRQEQKAPTNNNSNVSEQEQFYLNEAKKKEGNTEMKIETPTPAPVQSNPQLIINSKLATDFLIDKLKGLDGKQTIADAREMLINFNEMGVLEPQVLDFIKKHIEVRM